MMQDKETLSSNQAMLPRATQISNYFSGLRIRNNTEYLAIIDKLGRTLRHDEATLISHPARTRMLANGGVEEEGTKGKDTSGWRG